MILSISGLRRFRVSFDAGADMAATQMLVSGLAKDLSSGSFRRFGPSVLLNNRLQPFDREPLRQAQLISS